MCELILAPSPTPKEPLLAHRLCDPSNGLHDPSLEKIIWLIYTCTLIKFYVSLLSAAKYGKKVAVLDYVHPSTQGTVDWLSAYNENTVIMMMMMMMMMMIKMAFI